MKQLKPRDYQIEALEWALKKKKAVICMPTGTGKTLIAALWTKKLIQSGKTRKILVLEPTRFLVEQTHSFFIKQKISSAPLHGSLPKWKREIAWNKTVVIATPEIIVAEWDKFVTKGFDSIIIDECHHTTGKDSYKTVITKYDFKHKLGLTPYIPPSRKKEIISNIGVIKCWSWEDPRIKTYLPTWQTEIYEAPLNEKENQLYIELEKIKEKTIGKNRALIGNAIRWFVRDGLMAFLETMERSSKLKKLLASKIKNYLYEGKLRQAHKIDALERILKDHEGFQKTIVFVDRVIIAKIIEEKTSDYKPVLILGRRRIDPKKALKNAKRKDRKIIISTSAGEEGIDLPEADLLVVWSNTSSPLRFIQRTGRILRAVSKKKWRFRWIVFIVTPDTIDTDSLLDGLMEAKRAGASIDVDPETIQYLWSLSEKRRYLTILEKHALPIDILAKVTGSPLNKTRLAIRWMQEKGFIIYIYTPIGRIYLAYPMLDNIYKKYWESLNPVKGYYGRIIVYYNSKKKLSFKADYDKALNKLKKILEDEGEITRITVSIQTQPEKGVQRLLNLNYNYKITDYKTLKVLLDNAFSRETIKGKVLING